MAGSKSPRGSRKPDKVQHRSHGDRLSHEASRGVKTGAKALPQLSKARLTPDEFIEAATLMRSESDRGAAIMGAAQIEYALSQLLKAYIVRPDIESDVFEKQGAPMYTFRDKTLMAYAFGSISKETRTDIDLVRYVRNQFSHALRAIDFNSPGIKQQCMKMRGHCPDPTLYELDEDGAARFLFLNACGKLTNIVLIEAERMWDVRMGRKPSGALGVLNKAGQEPGHG